MTLAAMTSRWAAYLTPVRDGRLASLLDLASACQTHAATLGGNAEEDVLACASERLVAAHRRMTPRARRAWMARCS